MSVPSLRWREKNNMENTTLKHIKKFSQILNYNKMDLINLSDYN